MKKSLSSTLIAILVLLVTPSVAFAAKPPAGGGGKQIEFTGYDVSYPQCNTKLPTDHYFGIVGVNGGLATTINQCLANQLSWAATARDGADQPKVQLYVNTANPGEVSGITTWPTDNVDSTGATVSNPYGICDGQNNEACSWQYGWNRAITDDQTFFKPAAQTAGMSDVASDYTWWLDVELENSWQTNLVNGYSNNVATLEGMTAYFQSVGAKVGLYSTAYQWGQIVGNAVSDQSNLNGLANWRPSGSSLKNAQANCDVDSLTPGGRVVLTQYVQRGLDKNHSCTLVR